MRRYVLAGALLSVSLAVGCTESEKGPADPSKTPKANQEEIKKAMEKGLENMPAAQREKMKANMDAANKGSGAADGK